MNVLRFGAVLLLAGCGTLTSMDWGRAPADWPELTENVAVVDEARLRAGCVGIKYAPGARPVDCAWVNFTKRTCTVYVLASMPDALEHARGHCRGYDHPGETIMADGWAKWKARNPGYATAR